jgi:hypothetical protein
MRWALGLAERAIDALVWVDHEKIRAFMKAIDGTDVYAIGKFAFDAILGYYESHFRFPIYFSLFISRRLSAQDSWS